VLSLVILVSAVLVLSCRQTDRITEADDCYTHVTTVSMSKNLIFFILKIMIFIHPISAQIVAY